MTVLISAVNYAAREGGAAENTEAVLRWVRRLEKRNRRGLPHFILFPEMSLTGPLPTADAVLDDCRAAQRALAGATADMPRVAVLAGGPVEKNGVRYIGHTAFSAGRAVHTRLKTVLGPGESRIFEPAAAAGAAAATGTLAASRRDAGTAELLRVRFGIELCLETHYPGIALRQAEEGAQIIFCAFASPRERPREKHRRLLRYLPARGYDTTCFVVWCNLIFRDSKGRRSPGTAGIIGPKGRLLASRVTRGRSYLQAVIDLDEIERIRGSRMGFFRGRGPDGVRTAFGRPDTG